MTQAKAFTGFLREYTRISGYCLYSNLFSNTVLKQVHINKTKPLSKPPFQWYVNIIRMVMSDITTVRCVVNFNDGNSLM